MIGLDMFCATLIVLLFGLTVCFAGYRFFLALLPFWGFFFGFALGAQSLQALFGIGIFSSVTNWVVGFIVGALFAALSYLFYMAGVVITAGSLGYGLGIGMMGLFGLNWGLLTWLVGIGVALVVIAATIFLNLQKYLIIATTSLGGAALIVGTLVLGVPGLSLAQAFTDPVRLILGASPWWTFGFLVLAAVGIFVQIVSSRQMALDFEERYAGRI
jgi:hypothetical protein